MTTSKNILVVDDEPEIREVVSRMLESEKYNVTLASNATEAMDVFSSDTFDMVITDVMMPGEFSGIDFLKIIKAGFDTPVIVISGFGTMQMVLSAMRYGACDFITKPIKKDYLLTVVKNAFNDVSEKISEEDKSVEFFTRFDLKSDNSQLESVRMYILNNNVSFGLTEMKTLSLWLAIKESLKNAIEHGNSKDAGGKISLLINSAPRELEAIITDEGDGFKPHQTNNDQMDNRHHMKGLDLIRNLADGVEFNKKGNSIKLVFLK